MFESRELFGKTVKVQIPADVFPTNEQIEAMDAVTGDSCQHGWYESTSKSLLKDDDDDNDGLANLHYRYWLPPGNKPPKGVVIFYMGINCQTGHASRIDGRPTDVALVVDTFTAKGMAVYARDQYGHGFSEGKRFYIPSWKECRDDAISFAKLVASKHKTDVPLFLMGESFGGCMAMLTSKHFQDQPEEAPPNCDSILLVCPAIDGDIPPFPVYQILRYILAPLFHTRTPFFMPEPVTAERIWRDPKIMECYQDPEKVKTGLDAYGIKFRLGTAVGLLQAMEKGKTSIPDITTPFCVVHGDKDAAVPITGSAFLFEKSATPSGDKEFHTISDCYHGVIADPKAEEAMNHLSSFVDSRLKKFVPPK